VIREAMTWLAELKSTSLEPLKLVDREDRKVYMARDGVLHDVPIPAAPARHEVYTLEDFAIAVNRWGGERSCVFHSEPRVVLVIDDKDRRELVSMPIRTTQVWDRVLKLKDDTFDQRGFLRLLRFELASIIPSPLVAAIQKIEVVTSGNQRSEMAPGRERGTREFAADLANSGEIPDRVTCMVPVYLVDGLNAAVPITFALEYTLPPGPVSFIFRPMPDEIERTRLHLQGVLHGLLCRLLQDDGDGDSMDVMFGVPGLTGTGSKSCGCCGRETGTRAAGPIGDG